MSQRFENKVVVVTGAAQGIGKACAVRFAAEGASVMIADRAEEQARKVQQEIIAQGGEASVCAVDLETSAGAKEVMQATVDKYGRIDVSVHNVGGTIWAKLDAGSAEWYQRVDASKVPFSRVLENIEWAAQQAPIVLQCMFHCFTSGERPTLEEINLWASRIDNIFAEGGEISWIQVYTTARKPAQETVLPLDKEALEQIANAAREVVEKWGKNTKVTVSA